VKNEILEIIAARVSKEMSPTAPVGSPWERGSAQQDARMFAVAVLAVEKFEGDIVEIGCMAGGTTSTLGKIARDYGRRVIACDPWEAGRPNYNPLSYGKFLKNTEAWKDLIDIVRLPSEDERAIEYIKNRKLAFAYVDGDHDFQHCHRDIETVSHAGVICVDDMWNEDVRRAIGLGVRAVYWDARCKEAYLVNE
jgi:hypothetical protein